MPSGDPICVHGRFLFNCGPCLGHRELSGGYSCPRVESSTPVYFGVLLADATLEQIQQRLKELTNE